MSKVVRNLLNRLAPAICWIGTGFLLGKILLGCASTSTNLPHRDPAASWDQSNLKLLDHGCPSAVYVAPDGILIECQQLTPATSQKTDDEVLYFKTADAAAIAVVQAIYARSHAYEYGGVIVKTPKGYALSRPATQHHGMDVSFDEDPESYEFPIAGTYHVHPCLKNAFPQFFSPQDLAGARVARTPMYVLDECTGDVHYWAPDMGGYATADELIKLGVPPAALLAGLQLATGKIVGHITVDGVKLN